MWRIVGLQRGCLGGQVGDDPVVGECFDDGSCIAVQRAATS